MAFSDFGKILLTAALLGRLALGVRRVYPNQTQKGFQF